jgi:alkyldihydroxyacetonephosphate synthase
VNGEGVRRRSHWAWGYEDELPAGQQLREIAELISAATGFGLPAGLEEPVPLERARLPEPALVPPAALAGICSRDPHDRAVHAHGMAYRDLIRAFRGIYENVPDVVARPGGERELEEVLAWCETAGAAVVPFGGGTSVVGGVNPRTGPGYGGTVSLDMSRFGRVLEADPVSGAARIEAGAPGPALNAQLASHGLTLRHFPQSYEFSTLGGWIATRAGGHYATGWTRIDDFVESVRAITPAGAWESRRLPGSGAGPSPDAMLLGSEGTLGVITGAWVRAQRPPAYRGSVAVRFGSFAAGAGAVQEIAASGLRPSGCRLLDPAEAALAAGGDGRHALLLLAFESASLPVDAALGDAAAIAASHGGEWDALRRSGTRDGGTGRAPGDAGPPGGGGGQAGQWRDAFLRMPYLRNVYPAMGLIAETFETAITWDRFPAFHQAVLGAAAEAARDACGPGARTVLTCRLAFAYPDGPAPYYTVLAQGRRGEEADQWDAIKRAVSEVIMAEGGTITHHHAVGRDHRPWYDRQRPEPFAAALRAAKAAVDPRGILNPGVLLDPAPPGSRPGSPR